jgi:type IV fimbrial biogenesis protein FimT
MLEIAMKRLQVGFTMLELLIVIAIIAILSALAVPSYTNLIRRNNVASEGNKIIGALQLARTRATTGKYSAGICVEVLPGSGCNITRFNFSEGFVVFTKDTATAGTEQVEAVQSAFVNNRIRVDITTNVRDGLAFNKLGRLMQVDSAGAKFLVCWDGRSTTQVPGLKISVNASGRVQSERLGNIGICSVLTDTAGT